MNAPGGTHIRPDRHPAAAGQRELSGRWCECWRRHGYGEPYFIDGVEVSDPYRGLTGASLPYNIIREIEVKNGAYEAEYRELWVVWSTL